MSATGRGAFLDYVDGLARTEEAFTPYPLALAICEALAGRNRSTRIGLLLHPPRSILEPSAGRGAFVQASRDVWGKTPRIVALDTKLTPKLVGMRRTCSTHVHKRDFLTYRSSAKYDLVIGNPPYGPAGTNNAEKHVRRGLSFLTDQGVLAFVLRLNFLAGIERGSTLYSDHPPCDVSVFDKRPSFRKVVKIGKDGKKKTTTTDATEYGLFIFRKIPAQQSFTGLTWLRWSPYLKRWEHQTIKKLRRAR